MNLSDELNNDQELIDLELVDHWMMIENKPKVIVFDLDHTIWPFYVDLQVVPPFRKKNCFGREVIVDSNDSEIECFKDIKKILNTLKWHCFKNSEHLAVASKALSNQVAFELIDLFGFNEYFSSVQIYSMPKTQHINAIKQEIQFENYNQVLFYDDNKFNIRDTKQMGVFSFLVNKNNGLDLKAVHKSLDLYDRFYRK